MRNLIMKAFSMLSIFFVGCSPKTFHQGPMPDPGPYMVHFPEMDTDGDDTVTWEEFKQRFPDTTTKVFEAVDQNGDDSIDHDEWHSFKETHGE